MAAVMTGSLTACSGSSGTDTKATPAETGALALESKSEVKEEPKAGGGDATNIASSEGGSEGYEPAPVTDPGTIDDKSFNQDAWEELEKHAEGNSISYKYYQPQEGTTNSYLEAIGLTIEGGVKLVACPGLLFEEPIHLVQGKYPDVHFIPLGGEPHGTDYSYKTNNNVMSILLQGDRVGFLAGYTAVRDNYMKLGFMGGMAVPAVIRLGYGFVQGAESVAEEDGIMGLEIMYNYTGVFSATPEAQSIVASRYQNGTEVIFGRGGAAGNSVMAAAQEKNAKIIGMDVGQSVESETVTTFAMKLPSNFVCDGVKDLHGGSSLGGKTSVFTVASNGVGFPMDTSKLEKFSREQHGAIYEKLVDGEIGLVQFSVDNNDPTKDLTDLTNTKVTFVE